MFKLVLPIAAAGIVVGFATPVAARQNAAAAAREHRDDLASMLGLRVAHIDMEIGTLRDRDLIGREEAQELYAESRRLQQRLYGLSAREAADVELRIDRLENQVRLARDDARLGGHLFDGRDFDRGEDRYESERDSDRRVSDSSLRDPRGDPFAPWEARDRNED
jgi:hypothetical protein